MENALKNTSLKRKLMNAYPMSHCTFLKHSGKKVEGGNLHAAYRNIKKK